MFWHRTTRVQTSDTLTLSWPLGCTACVRNDVPAGMLSYAVCLKWLIVLAFLYPIIITLHTKSGKQMNHYRFGWSWKGCTELSHQTSDRLDVTMNDTHTTNGVDVGQCLVSSWDKWGGVLVIPSYRLGHPSHHPIQDGIGKLKVGILKEPPTKGSTKSFSPKIVKMDNPL